ncbi:MAG: hypothetical protein Q8R02_08075 [Hyphomonadaceae bacterium]|nr:hypothetical protein [Hyphomonadaceae bacterium]
MRHEWQFTAWKFQRGPSIKFDNCWRPACVFEAHLQQPDEILEAPAMMASGSRLWVRFALSAGSRGLAS